MTQNLLSVETYLKGHGPALSSDVGSYFQRAGLSPAAARKRIERAGGEVKRLRRIRLPHNQKFLYLEEQFGKREFRERLIEALDRVRSIFGHAFFGLQARGGIVPLPYFSTVSGCPERLKGHLPPDTVLQVFNELGAVYVDDIDELGPCVHLGWTDRPSNSTTAKARFVAEDILLASVTDWLRRLGLVSFHAVRTRNLGHQPDFGSTRWDVVGPSYLSALTTKRGGKIIPGFLAVDVFINDLDERSVRYFIHKFELLRNNQRLRPFIAILVAAGFSPEAMKALKSVGILCPSISNLFGPEILETLLTLLRTLENAAAVAVSAPNQIYTLFTKLGSFEGALGRMRGAMFELIVAHSVQARQSGSVDVGKRVCVPNTGDMAEIDVFHVQPNELIFYECKGYGPRQMVTLDEVRRWSETRIPRLREWVAANSTFAQHRQSFEFWTSSSFRPEAEEYLKSRWSNTRKFSVCWRPGVEVSDFVKRYAAPSVVKTLQEFYMQDVI